MTMLRRRGVLARRSLAVIAMILAVGASGQPAANAATSPCPWGSSQTQPWCTFVTLSATAQKSSKNLVFVGDSLLIGGADPQAWVQGVANNMATRTGRTTVVNATAGGSWVTYGWAGQQFGNSLLWDLSSFLQSRLTVAALATNDARIMTQQPAVYNKSGQYSVMAETVRRTLLSSRCVLLVNVAQREVTNPAGPMSAANAAAVNANMARLRTENIGKVHVADWNTYSKGKTSWFKTNDVHMTDTGSLMYYDYIATISAQLVAGGC